MSFSWFCWHRWGKWTDVYSDDKTWFQARTCERCNKKNLRLVW